jgi:Na+-translocating ferredoxin:NAD+ oxidoreductase subunit B
LCIKYNFLTLVYVLKTIKINKIDKLLPQTQCGLCEYEGCQPYAEAIVNQGERIDKCLPGGVEVLRKLGHATGIDPEPYIEEMQTKAKPPMLAKVREHECIGCTKCIQACPTDAIIGASKQMHTIITDACTGCELCVPPCPVDCIDMLEIPERDPESKKALAEQWRERYDKHQQRLQRDATEKQQQRQQERKVIDSVEERKKAIAAAMQRKLKPK